MESSRKTDIWIVIKSLSLIVIFSKDIILYNNGLIKPVRYYVLIYSLLFLTLMANDLFRFIYLLKNENACCISLIISLLLSNIIFYYPSSTGIYLYYLFLIYDITVLTLGMKVFKRRIILYLHFMLYCVAVMFMCLDFENDLHQNLNNLFRLSQSTSLFDLRYILPQVFYQPWVFKIKLYFWYSVPLLLLYLLSFLVFYQAAMKNKFQSLSEDLKNANKKLEQHSKIVEELAVANERNRIAQDMHDSLGHSLTALIMNLDVMERINEKDPSKIPGLIDKCQRLARGELESVRRVVFTLQGKGNSKGFVTSVAEMIKNIQFPDGVAIDFKSSDKIENLPPDIKSILFRIIQESITNSLRHSNATLISINLELEYKQLFLTITDNGKGTDNIIKSNGLTGIENRIFTIGGQVTFSSAENKGFKTTVSITLQ